MSIVLFVKSQAWRSFVSFVGLICATTIVLACNSASGLDSPPQERAQHERPDNSGEFGERRLAASASIFLPPGDMQDLVNRVDAIAIGTVVSVSATIHQGPSDSSSVAELKRLDLPVPTIPTTYYEIEVEEVFLDDGNLGSLSGNARLALAGWHGPMAPQKGDRMMFALLANGNDAIYSVAADWNMLHLDGGPIRNFDGTPPGYTGVTDEASLKETVQLAITDRVHLPPGQWPRIAAK